MELKIQDKDILKLIHLLRIKNKHVIRFVAGIEIYTNRVGDNHLFLLSAGIAFNIMLYLIPLLLVAVYVVNIIFGVDKVSGLLTDTIKDVLPPGEMSENLLASLLKEVNSVLSKSSVLGWIGIFSLLWLSSALFSSFRSALNRIFGFSELKFFLIYKFRDILVTIILMLLVLISTYALPIIEIVENMLKEAAPDKFVPFLSGIYFLAISLVTSFVMFYLLFRYVPTKKTPKLTLIMSTVLCVVLNEISRRGFAWYISGVTSYGSFYGTYAILASMALWVYYLVLIMLLSAELSKFFNDYLESKKLYSKEYE